MDRRGSVYVFSLGMVVLAIVVGAAILVRGTTEVDNSERSVNQAEAFQLADAALDQAMINLRVNNTASISSTPLASGKYWVDITSLGNQRYQVTAHGSSAGEQRDIEAVVERTPKSVFGDGPLHGDLAVRMKKGGFTDSYDSSQGDGKYNPNTAGKKGNISTNNTAVASIVLENGTAVNGRLIVGPDMTNPESAVNKDDSVVITAPDPKIVSAPQKLLMDPVDTQNLQCVTGSLNQSSTLPPNTTSTWSQSGSPYCYNALKTDQGSVITVSGNVEVYANTIDFDKNLEINKDGKPTQLILQLYGTSDVVIAKEGTFVGAIYAPKVKVNLQKVVDFYGSLVAKEVDIDKESKFHYDEALKNCTSPRGGYKTQVKSWRDL